MRPELEQIELIDRYLDNQLSASDRVTFEAQLTTDPNLREEVRLQQDIRAAIHNVPIRQQINRARQHYNRNIRLRWGGFGLGVAIVAAGVAFFVLRQAGTKPMSLNSTTVVQPPPGQPSYRDTILPTANEKGEARWAAADSNLNAQTFWLNPAHDTVIETRGGIVFSMPASGFLDSDNQPATGTIELTIKEALDPASIIKAGLVTRAGDRLLETGGMFFIDARKGGRPLSIDPAHAIYAEIPTDSIRTGMQLFTGKRLSSGTIDWTNPRPLEHRLLPVDIQTLNFYPPHYLDSLARWGYDKTNKTFTDSLYYSLASFFAKQSDQIKIGVVEKTDVEVVPRDSLRRIIDTVIRQPTPARRDTLPSLSDSAAPGLAACGINPAKIKAIWNSTFNNTLMSTREFEQRLIYIHQSADSNLLDLYVNHLDLDLSAIDSLAARGTSGALRKQFLAFAARRDGHVLHGDTRFEALRRYYRNKSTALTEAIAKTQKDFWDKQQQLDAVANEKDLKHDEEYYAREARNFREELDVNFRSALSQLGYDTAAPETRGRPIILPVNTYNMTINATGWCNVDRYVAARTSLRETIDYTDPQTGKHAIIKYRATSFEIKDYRQYDRVNVYLLPNKLSSFMRIDADSAGIFTEKLNSEMSYRLVITGYKRETVYYFMETDIQPAIHRNIPLTAIDKNSLDQRINGLANIGFRNVSRAGNTQAADLISEQDFIRFDIRDRQRRQDNKSVLDLTNKMLQAFFPCNFNLEIGRKTQPASTQ